MVLNSLLQARVATPFTLLSLNPMTFLYKILGFVILLFQIIKRSTGVYSWINLAVFAKKTVHFRRLWSIDLNSFSEELMESPLFNQPPTDLTNLVTLYNRVYIHTTTYIQLYLF